MKTRALSYGKSLDITLGGEVGNAATACSERFLFAPFDSLPWLRADLTNERVSAFDVGWDHVLIRPFKNFSGDISGRFIEIMAMNSQGDPAIHPAFQELLEEVVRRQRPGGYFCSRGEIDWQAPIDHAKAGDEPLGSTMMPALWGNARLLCGLVEVMRAFPERDDIKRTALALGDFYLSALPRFTDPGRMREYMDGGSFAAGYVTCWFPAMEGLVKLSVLSGCEKYLDAATKMATFYEQFDQLPIDHSHGMLCCHVSLLLLYQATGDKDYLRRVETRWDQLLKDGYINPAGGILEKCHVRYARDEGCAIVDWLRLNLALGQTTGNHRYWAMAERTLHNHFLQNQTCKGGFGHRNVHCDEDGVCGFKNEFEESTWCCTFHGELGFINLRHHLTCRDEDSLTVNFALDFRLTDAHGTVTSSLKPGQEPSEVVRQRLRLTDQPNSIIRVRQPHWADTVSAIDATGIPVALTNEDGWCSTPSPVNELELIYTGVVFAEDRHCCRLPDGPEGGKPFVVCYGPKILMSSATEDDSLRWPVNPDELKDRHSFAFPHLKPRSECCFVQRQKD